MDLKIIQEKLGLSLRALSAALGGSPAMCVYWKKSGHIPKYREAQIIDLAKRMKVKL